MAISNVIIEEGCISCGVCEATCDEVFEMPELAVVKAGVKFDEYEEAIKEAAENCPVEVIIITETE